MTAGGGATAELIVHRDAAELAQAVAARLVTKLADVLAAKDQAHLVLTGGTIGIGSLAAVAGLPARVAVDWKRVHLWWGDERFLPEGDPDRNETQARSALLDKLDLDPALVHAMPSTDGPDGNDAEAAAERYTAELARYAADDSDVPAFDVELFGMGPDGHVASLFPEHPGVYEEDAAVIAVHNSPKPPPDRLSFTFRTIRSAREVWVVAAGAEKAAAAHMALSGGGRVQVPAAGALGHARTLWLLDRAAAGRLPAGLGRLASP
ncbi:MAG: 6-phosphogluconolactonase [Actinocrinis sp.]